MYNKLFECPSCEQIKPEVSFIIRDSLSIICKTCATKPTDFHTRGELAIGVARKKLDDVLFERSLKKEFQI